MYVCMYVCILIAVVVAVKRKYRRRTDATRGLKWEYMYLYRYRYVHAAQRWTAQGQYSLYRQIPPDSLHYIHNAWEPTWLQYHVFTGMRILIFLVLTLELQCQTLYSVAYGFNLRACSSNQIFILCRNFFCLPVRPSSSLSSLVHACGLRSFHDPLSVCMCK